MSGLGFIDIESVRVRFPEDLFPYQGSRLFEVRHLSEVDERDSGWQPIRQASDVHCKWPTKHGAFFLGNFAEKNPFNIPGPFYGAMTDTCGAGPVEAPANVMLDSDGQEFLFRQPSNVEELRQVIGAAICDPFLGYGADGNSNWSLASIREWWKNRYDLVRKAALIHQPKEQVDRWRSYLEEEAEPYLRAYAFFVEERRLPLADNALPNLT